jgi:hypothetical protein
MEYVIHGKLLTYLRDARKKQSYYNLGKYTWSSIPPDAAQFVAGATSQAPRGWPDHLIQSESGSWSDIQLPSSMDTGSDVLSSRDLTRFSYQISRGMEYLASKGVSWKAFPRLKEAEKEQDEYSLEESSVSKSIIHRELLHF